MDCRRSQVHIRLHLPCVADHGGIRDDLERNAFLCDCGGELVADGEFHHIAADGEMRREGDDFAHEEVGSLHIAGVDDCGPLRVSSPDFDAVAFGEDRNLCCESRGPLCVFEGTDEVREFAVEDDLRT